MSKLNPVTFSYKEFADQVVASIYKFIPKDIVMVSSDSLSHDLYTKSVGIGGGDNFAGSVSSVKLLADPGETRDCSTNTVVIHSLID